MKEPRIGSLFSGYSGLEMGAKAVLGGSTAWHSEIDSGACKILEHRFPGVPNHGDVASIDWSSVEPVDVLTLGFPCQDLSLAGLRKGLRPGTRSGLWSHAAYAIDQLRPGLVLIENVRGLLSAGAHSDLEPCPWCVGDGGQPSLRALGAVLGDLAGLGYNASWQGLRAADVGAPHGRFRVFVVAWPAADADGRECAGRERDSQWGALGRVPAARIGRGDSGGEVAPHTADDGRQWAGCAWHGRSGSPYHGDPAADAEGHQRWAGRYSHQAERQQGHHESRGRFAAAGDSGSDGVERGGVGEQLATVVRVGAKPGAVGADVGQDGPAASDVHAVAVAQFGATDAGGGCGLRVRHDPKHPGPADGVNSRRKDVLDWGQYTEAVRRWERLTRSAPSPTEPGSKGQARLSPRFVEWMMGLPAGWVTDVPGLSRNEQLKALGNGVVPQQAAEALRLLLPDASVAAGAEKPYDCDICGGDHYAFQCSGRAA